MHRVTSPQNCSYCKPILIKLILHLWHSKLHLSILINRMTSPQNWSYRKPTTVMLTLYLWQTTVKFNTTPLTVIKFLPSSILNLWQLLSLGFHIEAETSDAKFNITPLASSSFLSSTIHLWQWLSLKLPYQSQMTNAKFKLTPLVLPPLLSSTLHLCPMVSLVFSTKQKFLWD